MLSHLKPQYFIYDVTNPLFLVIADLAARTGAPPSLQALTMVPGVPSTALQALGGYASQNRAIDTVEDATYVVNVLKTYHKNKLFTAFLMAAASKLEGDTANFDELRIDTEKVLIALSDMEDRSVLWHMGHGDNADKLVEMVLSEKKPGIPTGISVFDEGSNGWRKKSLICLASHYKGGKSTIALNIAVNMYKAGYSVLYLPFEMDDVETSERMFACVSEIETKKISQGKCSPEELTRIRSAMNQFRSHGVQRGRRWSVQSASAVTPTQLVSEFRAYKYDAIFCDYMKLMQPSGYSSRMGEAERLDSLYREMKVAATQLDTVLVGMAQVDDESGKARYSKSIYEHCNNYWSWQWKEAERTSGITEVSQIARSHEPFSFKIKVDMSRTKVYDMPPEYDITSQWNSNENLGAGLEGMFKL